MRLHVTSSAGQGTSVEVTGDRFVVGRDPACNLVLDDDKVSRQHAAIETLPNGSTVIRDLGSSNGTFVNGQRLTDPVELGSEDVVRIGSTTLKPSVERPPPGRDASLVAASTAPPAQGGPAREPVGRSTIQRLVRDAVEGEDRKLRRWVVAASALALLGIAGAAVMGSLVATGTIGGGGGQAQSVAALERATVLIQWQANGSTSVGSGSIIRRDGIILTNAHVAVPTAPGLALQYGLGSTEAAAPPLLSVGLFQSEAEPAKFLYLAKPIAYDGYLDVAVLRIVKTISGQPVSHLNLPTVPIGDSNTVRDGERVSVIGYPAVGGGFQGEINVSTGSVSGFQGDPRIQTLRAWMKTDAAIAHGNSGGLAADAAGHLIGIPSKTQTFATNGQSGLDTQGKIRPIALALPVIHAAEAGHAWTSPYFVAATGQEAFTLMHWAAAQPNNLCAYTALNSYPTGAPTVVAVFQVAGLAAGEDVDYVESYAPDSQSQPQPFDTYSTHWLKTAGSSSPCDWLSFTTRKGNGIYAVQVFAGPSLQPVSKQYAVHVGP